MKRTPTTEDLPPVVVLDTHVVIWLLQGNERLGPQSRRMINHAAQDSGVLIAAISAWEIAMLVAKGRLALDREVDEWLRSAFALPGIRMAELELSIAVDATRLPGDVHGDPSDRMIMATARHHAAVLLTEDRLILDYAGLGHLKAHRAAQ